MPVAIILFLVTFVMFFFLASSFSGLLENFFKRWQKKRMEKITPKLDRMFLDVPLKKLMILDIVTPFVSAGLGYIFTNNTVFALGFGVVGLVIPFFIIRHLELARRKKFTAQLVDALMVISTSLKASLSILQSFEAVVEEMPAPMSQEFGLVIRQMQMGVSLEEALSNLKKRMRVDELDIVVTAVMVARETGGELTETLSRVVSTLQEHAKLVGRVNALCIQAKLQGTIMAIIPIAFAGFVYKTNPHFFDKFLEDPVGKMLLYYAVISQTLGIFFIRKLSKIDI